MMSLLSPAVMELAILGIATVVLVALSALIFRVVQGPSPTLPSTVTEVVTRRRNVLRIATICLALWSVLSALDFVWMENRQGALFISVFILLLGVPILLAFYVLARKDDKAATLVTVDPWVRWEYDPKVWQPIAELRQGTAKKSLGKQTPQMVAGAVGLLFGDKFLAWNEPGVRLIKSWTESQPEAVLVFRFVLVSKTSMKIDFVAPIPVGFEADVRRLQTHLQALAHHPEVHLI